MYKKTSIMKNFKFLRTYFLLAVALFTTGIALSFKAAEKAEVQSPTVYHYVSDDMSAGAFSNVSNWSTIDDEVACGSERFRPCAVTIQEGGTLSAVLGSKTNTEVLNISEGYKPAP